ncbi:MAG: ComEC family competence protein [Bacteroidetes bacterium]|nr:ComEC family competence protein [Bacteroidota bacterium]
MLINLQKYPFLRLLIPLCVGIAFEEMANEWLSVTWQWLLVVVLCAFIFLLTTIKTTYSWRWMFGSVISLFMFIYGISYTHQRRADSKTDNIIYRTGNYSLARLIEPPEIKVATTRLLLELMAGSDEAGAYQVSGKVLAYTENSLRSSGLQYGDIILIGKLPEPVPLPPNPDQFNYHNYLKRKGIYHQMLLRENDWIKTGDNKTNFIYLFAYRLRSKLLQVLSENGLHGDEHAVASAILLGYDDNLPKDLRKGYVAAGAMHILCVSGLHVGIVFLIFDFLLGFLKRGIIGKTAKTLLLLSAVWGYALITGLAPSVMRAALMISFVLIGRLIRRKGNVINSLAASAFVLLLIQPMNLFHLGFQLSYSAVLGIVLFYKPIADLWYIKQKILRYFWEITAVSIAAQIGTAPLAVFYFNQFPVYFWLSNLVLVPLSFLVIVFGMAVLGLSFIPFLAKLAGVLTSGMLYILNSTVLWVERLPGSTLQHLTLGLTEVMLIYSIVLILLFMLQPGQRKTLLPLTVVFVLLFSSFALRSVQHERQLKLVVFSLKGKSLIDFIHGREHVVLADSLVMADESVIGYNVASFWTNNGLVNPNTLLNGSDSLASHAFLRKQGDLMWFCGKLVALCQKESFLNDGFLAEHSGVTPEVVIVSGNVPENLGKLQQRFQLKTLVLDGNIPPWHRKKWQDSAVKAGITFHDVLQQGAFVLDMNAPQKKSGK